ncbi:rod shape-determining protein MreC [Planktomarina sp.]|nr:rod shape-determining protein MreC [Planktomarina sp.]
MARDQNTSDQYSTALARLVLAAMIVMLLAIFLFWRIDNPRIEKMRMAVIDVVAPNFAWVAIPVTGTVNLVRSAQSYNSIYRQNQELRREIQQMKAWKEAALSFEQENARLLNLNKVKLDPKFTHITGVVLADSGSPFRQTVLLNVGARDGIIDGWAAMDGIGLVGRISGVGDRTARVIMLSDNSSRIPVTIEPTGQYALMVGDNSSRPPIDFVENLEAVRPGDRVVSSGDGGVFPAGLLIGQVVQSSSGRLRVRLAADIQRLEFLRIIRHEPREKILTTGSLVGVPSSTARSQDAE